MACRPATAVQRAGVPSSPRCVIDSTSAGDFDGEAAAFGLPVEQPVLDVLERDRAGVVVGQVALLLGPPVPGVAALVGEADQGVGSSARRGSLWT